MRGEDEALAGATVVSAFGDRIGRVRRTVPTESSSTETWVVVAGGFLGRREVAVPLSTLSVGHRALRLPFDEATVRRAPRVRSAVLSPADEAALRRHFGLGAEPATS